MTITELIAKLEAVRAEHGDCRVLTSNGPYGYQDDLQLDHGLHIDCGEYVGWRSPDEIAGFRQPEQFADETAEYCVRILGWS
ncbi:hypothetical protein [Hydrogenophaga intermedia]|uniref:Uncharacterized protein n=1 Tax=Hydrogenophaga intermedia TaxID=65786 RepID=A0A1L1P969_HYDIT|nr:hypothetical protein [Hydrogenophaga intermedia]TMU77927.1 hypothetical protein FGJ01_00835 [Hydrogenophaga intermedia]CDN85780.1 hypothetical protein BN948_00173 [Hydrogenophaga intermedia]